MFVNLPQSTQKLMEVKGLCLPCVSGESLNLAMCYIKLLQIQLKVNPVTVYLDMANMIAKNQDHS